MYLGIDGTGIPMTKKELYGRSGKQSDGTSKTREVKLAVIWTADKCDNNNIPIRDADSVTYNAAIESVTTSNENNSLSLFAQRVTREAIRRGYYSAERKVIIGDGAKWIWNMAQKLFPDAIQIIDLFHAKGTLSETAKEIFGSKNELSAQKAKQWRDELENGEIDKIIGQLKEFKSSDAARICSTYLETNRSRLQYPLFRQQGLCTSSGVVEAGCKSAIAARLKKSGMHWSLYGANAIIALRCSKLSARYDNYWERKMA